MFDIGDLFDISDLARPRWEDGMNESAPSLSRTIVFDAVGTLIRPVDSISAVYSRHGARHGITLEQAETKRRFKQARWQFFSNDPHQPSSDEIERQKWKQLVKSVFHELDVIDDLFDDLWSHYANPASWMIFPEVPACLKMLEQQQAVVAIASNFDSRIFSICRSLDPLDQIPFVFCSGTLGFRKPDRRFYEAVEKELRKKLRSFGEWPPVMVGDDLEKDVLGARKAGWQALHVDRGTGTLLAIGL